MHKNVYRCIKYNDMYKYKHITVNCFIVSRKDST